MSFCIANPTDSVELCGQCEFRPIELLTTELLSTLTGDTE